jgi:hypothetical protein
MGLALLTSCGRPATLGAAELAALGQLRHDVAVLATQLAAHHPQAARAALAQLRADLRAAHRSDAITDTKFIDIRAAAATLAGDLQSSRRAELSTPSTAPAPPPNDHDQGHGNKHGHGDEHGHGNGHGEGD